MENNTGFNARIISKYMSQPFYFRFNLILKLFQVTEEIKNKIIKYPFRRQ